MFDIFLYCIVAAAAAAFVFSRTKNGALAGIVGGACAIAGIAFFFAAMWISATSYEIISGHVTGKEVVYDPTTETYSCGTDSKGNTKTCTRTVPRWRFEVQADVGTWWDHSYSRWSVPSVYERAVIGEPFAKEKMFMNYQYVNEETVMVNKRNAYAQWLPDYPSVYDGYRVDHAFSNVLNVDELNRAIANAQKVWGPKYGVNVIVAIVHEKQEGFADALRDKWVGGKKNDVVLTMYINSELHVTRARVFSRSTSTKRTTEYADFNTTVRENAQRIDTVNTQQIIKVFDESLPFFEREDLAQHDYGAASYSASWWVNLLGALVILIVAFGIVRWLTGRSGPYRNYSWW